MSNERTLSEKMVVAFFLFVVVFCVIAVASCFSRVSLSKHVFEAGVTFDAVGVSTQAVAVSTETIRGQQ